MAAHAPEGLGDGRRVEEVGVREGARDGGRRLARVVVRDGAVNVVGNLTSLPRKIQQ